MKPEFLLPFLEALADKRRLRALLEVYRHRGATEQRTLGGVTLAEVCEATGWAREQAVNALGKLITAGVAHGSRSSWGSRLFFLPDTAIRGLVVEVCKLLDAGGTEA